MEDWFEDWFEVFWLEDWFEDWFEVFWLLVWFMEFLLFIAFTSLAPLVFERKTKIIRKNLS